MRCSPCSKKGLGFRVLCFVLSILVLGARVIQRDLKEAEEMKKSKDCTSLHGMSEYLLKKACRHTDQGVQGKAEASAAVVFWKLP